ncbi:MAG: hypothetical protein LBK97_04805 [Prevotellaceae bacterium]|jgi:hypothetical protein|nr:hypothetical protein [Prevotellaceae bacterium]
MKKSILIIIVLLFASCCKDEYPEPVRAERTVIAYMAADNDMSDVVPVDLEEMKRAYRETGVNLLVLMDMANETPYLLKITENGEQRIKTYQEFNSADPANMNKLLGEITEMYSAKSYGLILWSHGTSWLPTGMPLKSFAVDGNRQMNISDLAAALPVKFDFILFDACLMGAVEVAYELRNSADFIIASPTEIIDMGFPYDEIVPELLKPSVNLSMVAQKYFDYYNALEGAYRSASINLIDTKELENLAKFTAELISGNEMDENFDRTEVQRLDVYEEQYTFDFADFVAKAFPSANRDAFTAQLSKTVLYKAHTPAFLEEYQIETYCGLSCYMPASGRADLNAYYQSLQWYGDSRWDIVLNYELFK